MSGKLSWWTAAGLLALLVFLWSIRPDPDRVLGTEGPERLTRLLDSLRKGDLLRPSETRVSARLDFGDGIPAALRADLRKAFRDYASSADGSWIAPGEGPAWKLERPAPGALVLAVPPSVLRPGAAPPRTAVADFRSLLPPFLAILFAVLWRRTIPALFAGVLFGAVLARGFLGGVSLMASEWIVGRALGEEFKLQILGFILLLCASIGLMTRMGGIEGLVGLVKHLARTARSSQFATWLMGLLVFFDDYANTIVVGSTMRPLLDRLRVSREKLSYIVDSTAAPVAGLSMLSTWVAYEVSQFAGRLPGVTGPDGLPYEESQGFEVFLQTLPYRFYCLFTLVFVLLTILLKREWGPMLAAERRARRTGKVLAEDARPTVSSALTDASAKPGVPPRFWNALLPLAALIGITIQQIHATGVAALRAEGLQSFGFRDILAKADSTWAIFAGSAAAALLAALLALLQRLLGPLEILKTALGSMRALVFAVGILILAWCIGFACEELGTAHYLVALVREGFPAVLLPSILFLLSCLIAFATGSSWSTMAILLPNVVLLSHRLGEDSGFGGPALMILTIGAVLEGSIFGDHCSPISDTTILSSVASASDHMDHVKTQAPYALLTMGTALVLGYLPVTLLGPSLWPLSLAGGILFLVLFLLVLGKDPERGAPVPLEGDPARLTPGGPPAESRG